MSTDSAKPSGSGDVEQSQTGADENALRNHFSVGESKTLKIAGRSYTMADGQQIVSAWITDSDVDNDVVNVLTDGWSPAKGELGKFTRTEDDFTVEKVAA